KRTVVIRLVGTTPGAPARGLLYVNWRHADPDAGGPFYGSLPIQDDGVRMSLPVGARFSYSPRNLAGYLLDEGSEQKVVAGDGPQVVEALARPAGGIHGAIVRADGSPAASAFVTVFATRLPP